MKIIEAIKGNLSKVESGAPKDGAPLIIPDATRGDLVDFFHDMGYKKGAEIGVAKGRYSKRMCQAGMKVYPIDPYLAYPDYTLPTMYQRMDDEFERATKRLAKYGCEIIRKTSMQAVNDFHNESLDFVYIDGHHGFRYIAEDLCEWYKKVRKGGIISGHDYVYIPKKKVDHPYICHVKHVLPAFINAYDIENWYVLGKKDEQVGEKRDRFRSWFFIK